MRIVTLILFLTLASPAWATNYYVATNGNDGADGTIGAPWRTIQKATSMVKAGDTVFVRGGTYREYVTISASGSAGSRITFQSYPGETAIIDGSAVQAPNSSTVLVRVRGDYVTVKNFEVVNAAWMSVVCWDSATGCIIDGNTIHHGYHTGIIFYSNTGNTAQNNTVYDMYDFNSGGGNADCIDTSVGGGRHTYINNVVHDCSDDGFDGWASTGNTYIGNISYHNGFVPFTSTPKGNGNGFKLGGLGGGGHTVVGNVSWNNRDRGFDDNTGANNRLYNNTAIANPMANYNFPTSGAVLENNIAYTGGSGNLGGAAQTKNSWNLGISNPMFVQITNPAQSTFARLQSGSPAINVGATVAGSPHTCVGVCDLGAYEFSSGGGAIPAAPTGLQVR